MGAPISYGYVCAECGAKFRLDNHERFSRTKAKCPGCGGIHYERRKQENILTRADELAGQTAGWKPKRPGTAGQHGSERREVRMAESARKQAWLLSAPTRYRLAALRDRHTKRKAVQAKAERRQREADFTPL